MQITTIAHEEAEQALHAAALLTEALDQQGPGAGGTALREQLAAELGVTPEEYVRLAHLGVEIGQALRTTIRRDEMSRPTFDDEWLYVTDHPGYDATPQPPAVQAAKSYPELAQAYHLDPNDYVLRGPWEPFVGHAETREETTMDTAATTEYGTWADATNHHQPEDGIAEYLGDQGHAYDAEAIAAEYRAAVNATLPEGVTLAGDQLYGPHPRPADYHEQVAEAIGSVDLAPIVDRHER